MSGGGVLSARSCPLLFPLNAPLGSCQEVLSDRSCQGRGGMISFPSLSMLAELVSSEVLFAVGIRQVGPMLNCLFFPAREICLQFCIPRKGLWEVDMPLGMASLLEPPSQRGDRYCSVLTLGRFFIFLPPPADPNPRTLVMALWGMAQGNLTHPAQGWIPILPGY